MSPNGNRHDNKINEYYVKKKKNNYSYNTAQINQLSNLSNWKEVLPGVFPFKWNSDILFTERT